MPTPSAAAQRLARKLEDRTATVGVIGRGYVGLPLALQFESSGLNVIGFDIDAAKIDKLNAGHSRLRAGGRPKLRGV